MRIALYQGGGVLSFLFALRHHRLHPIRTNKFLYLAEVVVCVVSVSADVCFKYDSACLASEQLPQLKNSILSLLLV